MIQGMITFWAATNIIMCEILSKNFQTTKERFSTLELTDLSKLSLNKNLNHCGR
jgi:hypothetical protein